MCSDALEVVGEGMKLGDDTGGVKRKRECWGEMGWREVKSVEG